jgi:hypothetical protein
VLQFIPSPLGQFIDCLKVVSFPLEPRVCAKSGSETFLIVRTWDQSVGPEEVHHGEEDSNV